MSHQQSFSYVGTGHPGLSQYQARINVLAQGHNTVTPVRLEPATPWSRDKHSTTDPLHSKPNFACKKISNLRVPPFVTFDLKWFRKCW